MGGLLGATIPSAAVKAMLTSGSGRFDWMAATVGSNNASGYQLATQRPVMPIGGFNGTDPSPTLAQFRKYVTEGRIHWFIGGGLGGGGARGGSRSAQDIASWVADNYQPVTVDGVTLYDLTSPR